MLTFLHEYFHFKEIFFLFSKTDQCLHFSHLAPPEVGSNNFT